MRVVFFAGLSCTPNRYAFPPTPDVFSLNPVYLGRQTPSYIAQYSDSTEHPWLLGGFWQIQVGEFITTRCLNRYVHKTATNEFNTTLV